MFAGVFLAMALMFSANTATNLYPAVGQVINTYEDADNVIIQED